MSELSFLIDLLLNHDLPKATKDLIAERIKFVEDKLLAGPPNWDERFLNGRHPGLVNPIIGPSSSITTAALAVAPQAPSTLALMAKHGDITLPIVQTPIMPPVVPVEQVAQTPATAAAMNHRYGIIADSLAGKVEKGRTSPRKC